MTQNKLIYEEPVLEMIYLYNVVDTLTGSAEGVPGEDDFDDLLGEI